jgi:hypothetical protein
MYKTKKTWFSSPVEALNEYFENNVPQYYMEQLQNIKWMESEIPNFGAGYLKTGKYYPNGNPVLIPIFTRC